jgi:hypothetical protein
VAFIRLKAFWGAVDIEFNDEAPYTPTQTKALGPDANEPNIAVRRAQIVWKRVNQTPAQDAIVSHFDFLNITNGEPDDTWTDADFTSLEDDISVFLATMAPFWHTTVFADQIRWYRVGAGVLPPNPAVRIKEIEISGGAASSAPPQVCMTSTYRTVPRRQWGRSYWPFNNVTSFTPDGRIVSATVDSIGTALNNLFTEATNAQFLPVITSERRGKAYTVERIQVDNVPDVIRSRRVNESTHTSSFPVP